jgi:type IV pilus assembly protein PilM
MSMLSSFRAATPPTVAVEFSGTEVSVASVEMRSGKPRVAAFASEPLPALAVAPSLTVPNIHDRAAVVGALGRAFDRIGARPRRVGIILPDAVARVSIVRFDQVPALRKDLDQLVRWQVRKTAPFAIEDAQVSYVPGLSGPEGHEFIVSTAKADIVKEYEGVCLEVGANPGLVDLSTFSVLNAVMAGGVPGGDWLLLHVGDDFSTIAIVRGEHLILFRNRAEPADDPLPDLVHQTAMYYEDRLKGSGFKRVVVAGLTGVESKYPAGVRRGEGPRSDDALDSALRPPDDRAAGASLIDFLLQGSATGRDQFAGTLRQNLESRLTTPIEALDPRSLVTLTDRVTASPRVLSTLAPLVGLLLRGQEAA